MSTFKTQPTLLVFWWLLEVDASSSRNHMRAWEKKKTIWKPQKLEQFLNQNEKAMCLKKHEKK